ncbi:KilA-N domain-containing protein [Veronia pacifica]|uniref:KilA-N domain-containing protein n=1 Tax=Veronia pacifica TaxID=1080227 RepID=A0A1C3E6K3_9GAMM|nr:KilA-N domain-containing protein [Veronia pacifica]ODA28871.1 hypothetical protein A8L45_22915 [Veronia pacifica]
MQTLVIESTRIRTHQGLYCLNDLHKVSGAEKKHQPALYFQNQQTKDLIVEIESQSDQGNPRSVMTKRGGNFQGTWVCKELVYAYAMWISAKFHLQVIRAFDSLQNTPKTPTIAQPPRMRMLVSIEQGQVVSTQLIAPECMVFDPNKIHQLIEEPGYFNANDYRRIIEVATGKLSELAAVASQR